MRIKPGAELFTMNQRPVELNGVDSFATGDKLLVYDLDHAVIVRAAHPQDLGVYEAQVSRRNDGGFNVSLSRPASFGIRFVVSKDSVVNDKVETRGRFERLMQEVGPLPSFLAVSGTPGRRFSSLFLFTLVSTVITVWLCTK